jgi:hypothetical protein
MSLLGKHVAPIAHNTIGSTLSTLLVVGGAAAIGWLATRSVLLTQQPLYKALLIGASIFILIAAGVLIIGGAVSLMRRRSLPRAATIERECSDQWLHEVAREQAQHLTSLIQIVNGLISDHDLISESPFIELRFLLKNSSVFPVSIPNFGGKLLFGNYQFDKEPTFIGKPVTDLLFWHHGGFDLRQELSKHEAVMILNSERASFAFHRMDFPFVVDGVIQNHSLVMSCEITNDVLMDAYPKLKSEIKQSLLTTHYNFDTEFVEDSPTGCYVSLQVDFRNPRLKRITVIEFKLDTSPHMERVTASTTGLIYQNVWLLEGRVEHHTRLTPNLSDDVPIDANREEPIEGWVQFYLAKVSAKQLEGKAVTLVIVDTSGEEHRCITQPLQVTSREAPKHMTG